MTEYKITISADDNFLGGWHWSVALPKKDPKDIGMAITGYCMTVGGAKRAAKRCVKRQKRAIENKFSYVISV